MLNTKKTRSGANNKIKLISSICMLLIASIMVVTSTYAWIVLSTAPEVREITTTVGANGALEIKLNIPNNPDDRNSLFRNIVDFRNVSYGLDQVALLPSIAVSGDNFADEMLLIPEYGDDGLATGSGNSNKVLIGSLSDEDNAFHESDTLGVRVVGSATGVTARQGIYNSAMSAARSAMSSAKSNAISSLKNDAFMGIVIKMMSNDSEAYSAEDVAALETIIARLETSVGKMEEAYKHIIIAAAASDNGQDDIVASLVKDAWGSNGLTLESIAASGAISVGEHSVSVDSSILAGIRALQTTAANVAEARDLYDNLGGDYSTANVNPIITKLVNRSYVTVNGSDPADVDFADVVLNGAVITMNPGAGVYVEIADQVGNYNANISNNISMVTASSRSSGYIASAIADVADVGAPGGDSSELPMTAFYGYILDLVFRTNAENSHLLLQTDAIDRIDNNNPTDGTMGGGSYMKFTATEGTGITNEQVIKIMSCFRVVFFDTTSKAVLGRAQLDADGAVINSDESVSAKLYMDGSTEITSLTRNEEHKISVLVYLDAEMLENQHVAATTATSITGVMNIQFASDADLKPAQY